MDDMRCWNFSGLFI